MILRTVLEDLLSSILDAFDKPLPPDELAKRLDAMAAKNPQKLDWRHSIVDLMKLVNQDSSLDARKKLAQELGYTGELTGSAEMNMWLHRQVMQKLSRDL